MTESPRLIFDGDYPMAHTALDLNRDLLLPIDAMRASPQTHQVASRVDAETLATIPEMRSGGVAGGRRRALACLDGGPAPAGGPPGGGGGKGGQAGRVLRPASQSRKSPLLRQK